MNGAGAHWNHFEIKHSSRAVKWKKNWLISLCVFAFTGSRLIPKFTPFFMFAHFFYSNDSGNYGTFFRVIQTLFVHYVNLITHLSKKNSSEVHTACQNDGDHLKWCEKVFQRMMNANHYEKPIFKWNFNHRSMLSVDSTQLERVQRKPRC